MGWSRQLKLAVSFSVLLLFMPFTTNAASAKDGMLIPMGHSIGIKMDLSGVFITNDVMISKDNWLKAGDLIGQLNNVAVSTLTRIRKSIDPQCVTKKKSH